MDDLENIQQKILKIRNRNKQKNNYTNIKLLPTIYDEDNNNNNIDCSGSSILPLQVNPIPPPDLITLYNNGEDKIKKNKEIKEIKETVKNTTTDYLLSTYHYFFPVKEGATGSDPAPAPFDPMNMSFWNLPCDFLNMDFYTNLISTLLEKQADYSKDPTDFNKKNDRAIIKTLFDQMIMILVAFVMTYNIYYFCFMYKWDCRHWGFVPGHGMYFGKKANDMVDFFLRDSRKPVFYCRLIYTTCYPMIFELLEVRKYKRLSFLFIFLFMLCFVFITSKHIGLSAHSFIVSGKINPLVVAIVMFSAFTGIFFTSKSDELDALTAGLKPKEGCDGKTISDELDNFGFSQNAEKKKGRPYYYSIKEKYMDFKEEVKKYTGNDKPTYINDMQLFIDEYKSRFEPNQNSKAGIGPTTDVFGTAAPASALPGGLDKKQINEYALLAFGKFKTVIMAIIRFIIAMAFLPIAQIFVSCFFLYTTSGIGLLIEEGGLFTAIRRIKYHMNDNDGEDEHAGEINHFYAEINNTNFFKFWINELFLTTIYTIFVIVKFATVPTQLSKIEVKISTAIIIGAIAAGLVIRSYILHNRHCNMNVKNCFFKQLPYDKIRGTASNINPENEQRENRFTKMKQQNKIFNYVASNDDEINIEINKLKELLPILQNNQHEIYQNIIKNNPNGFISTNSGDIGKFGEKIKQNRDFVKPIIELIKQYQSFFNKGDNTIDEYIEDINAIKKYLNEYKSKSENKDDNELKDIEIRIRDKENKLNLPEGTNLLLKEGDIIRISNEEHNEILLGTIENHKFVLNKDLNIREIKIKNIINNINEIPSTQIPVVPTINTDVIEENVTKLKTKYLPFFQNNQYEIYKNIGINDKNVDNIIEKIKQYQSYFNTDNPTDIETKIDELNLKESKGRGIGKYLTYYESEKKEKENKNELDDILDSSKLIITDKNQIKLKLSISNDDSKDKILKKLVNFKLEKGDRITINNNILLGTMEKVNMLSSSLKFVLNKDLSIQDLNIEDIEGIINAINGQYNNEIKDKIHISQPIHILPTPSAPPHEEPVIPSAPPAH